MPGSYNVDIRNQSDTKRSRTMNNNSNAISIERVYQVGQKVLVEGTADGNRVTREQLALSLRKELGLSRKKGALNHLVNIVTGSVHLGFFNTPKKTFRCRRGRDVGGIICVEASE